MAQTYEVHLRKRLTEIDLIIQNLTYYSSMEAHTKIYLNAMINYLCLQKFIVGKHNMSLQAEIDGLLMRMFNAFRSEGALTVHAEMGSEKLITVSSGLSLQTSQLEAHEKCFNTFSTLMNLTTAALKTDIEKSMSADIEMTLTARVAKTLKTAFEKLSGGFALDADVAASSQKFAGMESGMRLQTAPAGAAYLLTTQCEALLNLSFAAEANAWVSLGFVDGWIVLDAHIGEMRAEKFCSMNDTLRLLGQANAVLVSFVTPAEVGLNLATQAAETMLRRLRKISEIDPIPVSVLDEMSVADMDYITLE